MGFELVSEATAQPTEPPQPKQAQFIKASSNARKKIQRSQPVRIRKSDWWWRRGRTGGRASWSWHWRRDLSVGWTETLPTRTNRPWVAEISSRALIQSLTYQNRSCSSSCYSFGMLDCRSKNKSGGAPCCIEIPTQATPEIPNQFKYSWHALKLL